MAGGKTIIVDTTLCTACRGCQVACKQWNGLPAVKTTQTGTYQNPPDFTPETYKVVRFAEGRNEQGKPYWYFFSDMCRHCLAPACIGAANKDEIVQDEATGAVIFKPETKNIDGQFARESCPFDIPRVDPKTKVVSKCTMCFDRITNDLPPACVRSCPTGAMLFGERDEMLKQLEIRLAELKPQYPKVQALNPADVRVIFIVTDDPKRYYEFAAGR